MMFVVLRFPIESGMTFVSSLPAPTGNLSGMTFVSSLPAPTGNLSGMTFVSSLPAQTGNLSGMTLHYHFVDVDLKVSALDEIVERILP